MSKELKEALKALFTSRPEINTAYVTSDDNIFTAETYAHNWSVTLAKKGFTPYTRNEIVGVLSADAIVTAIKGGDNGGKDTKGGNDDTYKEARATASKRYIELFDTKPTNFMKTEDIIKKIAEKETELKAAETDDKKTDETTEA